MLEVAVVVVWMMVGGWWVVGGSSHCCLTCCGYINKSEVWIAKNQKTNSKESKSKPTEQEASRHYFASCTRTQTKHREIEMKIEILTEKINGLVDQAEEAGNKGDVEEAKEEFVEKGEGD